MHLTTEGQVRREFWSVYTGFRRRRGWRQNNYPADVRCAFVDFVDYLSRSGQITERLAERVTL